MKYLNEGQNDGKTPKEDIKEMTRLWISGEEPNRIAQQIGVSRTCVMGYCRHITRPGKLPPLTTEQRNAYLENWPLAATRN